MDKNSKTDFKLKIEYISIDELQPYSKNARKHEKYDVAEIAKSIQKYGFSDPIGIWSDHNVIVEGHGRLLAAKSLGMTEVPCIRLDHLTDEERREYAILHNKTAELSSWDWDALSDEVKELDFGDFDIDWGLDDAPAVVEAKEDDFAVEEALEAITEPKTHRGDIYQLGEHRLMCGDSTKAEEVALLMDGALADMLLTDPPYNVDYEGKNAKRLKIENDNMSNSDFREFLKSAFECARDIIKPGSPFYIWHADSEGYNFRGACVDVGLTVRQCLIWEKNGIVLGRQDYQWQHEPCLYGWKDGAAHKWYSDRKQSTILKYNKPLRNEDHPTMKPVALFSELIQNSSQPKDLVVDLFAGSGTTIVASEQLDRKVYAMELKPEFCDVIVERWEKLTGKKAVKIREVA